uniref:Uncharacterized protein n=1 Tax=Lactuca sativa TaxID=4236 RepID=A0A9R1WS02_LACSA|nr:hypothetical protein LSAT_V11C100040270 [Lactuca sativa]
MCKHWNIEDDRHKKQVLKICNQAWKAYKRRLVTEYLKKGKNPYLDEPTWNAFVQLKTSPSFQEISNKATETTKLNKYPPRIGPRGYGVMKPEWEKEMESGDSTELHNIRNTQLSHGDWFPGPEADVLTEVLGPEHPGRTRSVGHNVGLRQSMPMIDKKKRKSHDKCNLEDIKEKMKIEVEAMMEAKIEEMNDQIEEMKTYMHYFLSKNEGIHITSPVLKKNSVVSTVSDELDGIKTPTACELVIPYSAMN